MCVVIQREVLLQSHRECTCEPAALPDAGWHHHGLMNWHPLAVGEGGSVKIPLDQLRHFSLAPSFVSTACFHPLQEHFLTPFNEPGKGLRGNDSVLWFKWS